MHKLIITIIVTSFFLTGCLLAPSWKRNASYPSVPPEVDDNRTEMVKPEPRIPSELDGDIPLEKISTEKTIVEEEQPIYPVKKRAVVYDQDGVRVHAIEMHMHEDGTETIMVLDDKGKSNDRFFIREVVTIN